MQKLKFVQIYKENHDLYQDLLPKWINFIKELNEHDNISKPDDEIIHDLNRRVNIQGNRKDMHFELFYCDDMVIGLANFAIDIGTIYGLIDSGYGTVMGFYIIPEFRRKGYGRIFYEHIEKVLINDGAKSMYVCPDPVTGEPFWSAMGFRDSGKIDPDDKLPIYIKNVYTPENMIKHFNNEAVKHDNNFINDMQMKPFYDEIEIQLDKCIDKNNILVLGCGTGLEIERIKSKSKVTAVDISENMLKELSKKNFHEDVDITTICGSILDIDFTDSAYDIVLSCYAMHHFNHAQKLILYKKIYDCLKPGGVFINGDTMSKTKDEESRRLQFAESIYHEQNKPFGSLHIDIPFCYEHETDVLCEVGFNNIILEREWDITKLYKAIKSS